MVALPLELQRVINLLLDVTKDVSKKILTIEARNANMTFEAVL